MVENRPNSVRIRAARDNFSPRRKLLFVRHLAAEGYIPDSYQRQGERDTTCSSLDWVVDNSLLTGPYSARSRSVRQILLTILIAGVLWLALMAFAFLHAPR